MLFGLSKTRESCRATGRLCGSRIGPAWGEVMGLYLVPELKGLGLGKRILELLEAWARENGLKTLELGSTLTSAAFYRARGYSPTGPQGAMRVQGVDIPYIPMRKELN